MCKKNLMTITFLLVLFSSQVFLGFTQIIYVDGSLVGPGDGNDWSTAYKYLQDALDEAASGDQIWVAAGTYYPDEDYYTTPVDHVDNNSIETFQLKTGVEIYGGFAGDPNGETSLEQRDWKTNQTILSGDIDQDGLDAQNSCHVVTGSGVSTTAVLDGFIIEKGYANGDYSNEIAGGGIFTDYGSPTIKNCVFTDNYAKRYGGGAADYFSSSNFINCFFYSNYSNDTNEPYRVARAGGGAYSWTSSTQFKNCVFVDNISYYNADPCNLKISIGGGVTFSNCKTTPYPKVINCTFYNNSSYQGLSIGILSSHTVITNCILWDDGTQSGQEIYNGAYSNPTITYCDIRGGYTANIDSHPLFMDASSPVGDDEEFFTDDDGLQLVKSSPCVDAANDNVAPTTDILGNSRIDNKIGIGTSLADMGAYEAVDSYTYYEPNGLYACGSCVYKYTSDPNITDWDAISPSSEESVPWYDEEYYLSQQGCILSICGYDGFLYAGAGNIISRYDGEDTWNRVGNFYELDGNPELNGRVIGLIVYQNELYASVTLQPYGLDWKALLYVYEGGTTWTKVFDSSVDSNETWIGFRSMYVSDVTGTEKLWVGDLGIPLFGRYSSSTWDENVTGSYWGMVKAFTELNGVLYSSNENGIWDYNSTSDEWSDYDLFDYQAPLGAGSFFSEEIEVFGGYLYVGHGPTLKHIPIPFQFIIGDNLDYNTVWYHNDSQENSWNPEYSVISMAVTQDDDPLIGDSALIFGTGWDETGEPLFTGSGKGRVYRYRPGDQTPLVQISPDILDEPGIQDMIYVP